MSRTNHARKVQSVPAIELRRLVDAATVVALQGTGFAVSTEKQDEARGNMATALGVVRERLGLRPLADLRTPR